MPHSRGPTFILKTNLNAFFKTPTLLSLSSPLFIHVSPRLPLSSCLAISFTCSPTLLLSFCLIPLTPCLSVLALCIFLFLLHLIPFFLLCTVSHLPTTHTSLLYFTIFPTSGSLVDYAIEQNHCQIFIIIK